MMSTKFSFKKSKGCSCIFDSWSERLFEEFVVAFKMEFQLQ
jgi:hypothetical protein